MNRLAVAVLVLVLLLAAAGSSMFVVHRGQYAAVYAMGKVERVETEPGLYLKWPSPLQNLLLVDARLQTLRSAQPQSVAIAGSQGLAVSWFVQWRVVDARSFLRQFGESASAADERLAGAMRSALAAELGALDLAHALQAQRGALPDALRTRLAQALHGSGIEIVDAGLTQLDYAAAGTESVYRRMTGAQQALAERTRAEGQAQADKMRAEADKQREVLLAQAYRKAQTLKGEGDAQAAEIYARSFGKDPEFAAFYRSLEAHRASFANRSDVMVLDPSSDFFRFMRSPAGQPAAPSPRKH